MKEEKMLKNLLKVVEKERKRKEKKERKKRDLQLASHIYNISNYDLVVKDFLDKVKKHDKLNINSLIESRGRTHYPNLEYRDGYISGIRLSLIMEKRLEKQRELLTSFVRTDGLIDPDISIENYGYLVHQICTVAGVLSDNSIFDDFLYANDEDASDLLEILKFVYISLFSINTRLSRPGEIRNEYDIEEFQSNMDFYIKKLGLKFVKIGELAMLADEINTTSQVEMALPSKDPLSGFYYVGQMSMSLFRGVVDIVNRMLYSYNMQNHYSNSEIEIHDKLVDISLRELPYNYPVIIYDNGIASQDKNEAIHYWRNHNKKG